MRHVLSTGELYRLRVQVLDASVGAGGKPAVVDEYVTTFGARTVEVAGGQLRLNGRAVRLRGFGKHEDFPVIGKVWSNPRVARRWGVGGREGRGCGWFRGGALFGVGGSLERRPLSRSIHNPTDRGRGGGGSNPRPPGRAANTTTWGWRWAWSVAARRSRTR